MLNDIKIHGYLGRDPEMKEIEGQNGPYKRVTFSVGVSRDYGDETDWFYCAMTRKRAEVIEKFFRKGSQIIVSGRMESYKPKNDPQRTAWVLKVAGFDFCDKKTGGDSGENTSTAGGSDPEGFEPTRDDDLPF